MSGELRRPLMVLNLKEIGFVVAHSGDDEQAALLNAFGEEWAILNCLGHKMEMQESAIVHLLTPRGRKFISGLAEMIRAHEGNEAGQ